MDRSRSPHGERGLKYLWQRLLRTNNRRSPHGERGLKFPRLRILPIFLGRSPHGERGLKSNILNALGPMLLSLPPRGAWIEIR